MADDKRYYWLKLKRDFFKRHDIQIIESMPNGKDYILFYLKLLCESVDHEGNLRFSDEIPYNVQMLSALTNTNIDVVKSAVDLFSGLHMIDILDDGTYYMNQVEKMIGSETYWAQKKREQRKQLAGENLDNVQQLSIDSPKCPSKSIENRDKSIDIESEDKYDIYDKYDKSENSPLKEHMIPNSMTQKLIENGYISEDDSSIDDYNAIFDELIDKHSFEKVRSCLWYFIKRYKASPTDEEDNEIQNKFAYFRTAMVDGAKRLDKDKKKTKTVADTLCAERMESKEESKTVADDPELLERLKKLVGVE